MGKPEKMTSGCTIIFKSNWIAGNKIFNCDMNPKTQTAKSDASPAYYPADWRSHRGYLLSSVFWFLFLVCGNLPLPWLVHTWHAALSPHVLAHSDLQGNATCIAEHSCLP